MNAVRVLKRNRNSTTITSTDPMRMSRWTLRDGGLDEVGGAEESRMEGDLLRREERLQFLRAPPPDASVVDRIFAPSWPCTIRNTPGLPSMSAALMEGAGPSTTSRDVAMRTTRPSRWTSTASANPEGLRGWPSAAMTMRWLSSLHEAGAEHAGRPARGRDDVLHRQAEGDEPLRVDLHLPLPHLAAEHVDVCHARHRQQVRAHGPVHQRADLHQTSACPR